MKSPWSPYCWWQNPHEIPIEISMFLVPGGEAVENEAPAEGEARQKLDAVWGRFKAICSHWIHHFRTLPWYGTTWGFLLIGFTGFYISEFKFVVKWCPVKRWDFCRGDVLGSKQHGFRGLFEVSKFASTMAPSSPMRNGAEWSCSDDFLSDHHHPRVERGLLSLLSSNLGSQVIGCTPWWESKHGHEVAKRATSFHWKTTQNIGCSTTQTLDDKAHVWWPNLSWENPSVFGPKSHEDRARSNSEASSESSSHSKDAVRLSFVLGWGVWNH